MYFTFRQRRLLFHGLDSNEGFSYIAFSSFFNFCFPQAKMENLKASFDGECLLYLIFTYFSTCFYFKYMFDHIDYNILLQNGQQFNGMT